MDGGTLMRAVMALSGGMDSTALLMRLLADGYTVSCLSYNYGQKHVIGKYNIPDGSNYVGEWIDSYRDGNGVYTFKDGSKKAGIFKKNKFLGDSYDG